MDLGDRNIDTYNLITDLCKHFIGKCSYKSPYAGVVEERDVKALKRLRSKAFEILLNKTDGRYNDGGKKACKRRDDPVEEILKYVFILRLNTNHVSNAQSLESLLDEIPNDALEPGMTVYSTLQLIVELKNYQFDQNPNLDIFFYGKTNQLLPKLERVPENIELFQVCPVEVFMTSEKFQTMLNLPQTFVSQYAIPSFTNRAALIGQYQSMTTIKIESIGSNETFGTTLPLENYHFGSYFSADFIEDTSIKKQEFEEYKLSCTNYFALPQPCTDIIPIDNENVLEVHNTSNHSVHHPLDEFHCFYNFNEELMMNHSITENCRTWENLGIPYPKKQTLFTTETPSSILHLTRIDQTSILPLLPRKLITPTYSLEEMSINEFMPHVRLLLLGIESSSFQYTHKSGFNLRENITVKSVSRETLMAVMQNVVHWGNCYKSLSRLVSGKVVSDILHQESPIFKAICNSIKELLLYYQASLLRIFATLGEKSGLLQFVEKLRPISYMITEVDRLCHYTNQNSSFLVGGSNILTYIYEEITKVTNPKVALVFYSILKSCCDVYFQYLQKWIFDGDYDDIYGEFMIKAQPQYLRNRGYKFWTKSFTINWQLVPGFLKSIAESILQCGKTIRLLKICDPKNPVCNIPITFRPQLKVCLSERMLHEQISICQKYENKSVAVLGSIISFSSAIEQQKRIEREKVEQVIRAQHRTLFRIKKEQKELLEKAVQNKRELFKELKEQAEQAASNREREKEEQLLADKLFLEKMKQDEDRAKELENILRVNMVHYYGKLAEDIESRRMHSDWRMRRMKLFDKRFASLSVLSEELPDCQAEPVAKLLKTVDIPKNDNSPEKIEVVNKTEQTCLPNLNAPTTEINLLQENACIEDLNSNIPEIKIGGNQGVDEPKINTENKTQSYENDTNNLFNFPTNRVNRRNNERSDLQDFLREEAVKEFERRIFHKPVITTQDTETRSEMLGQETAITDNITKRPRFLQLNKIKDMTEAQYNKFKVLHQEFGMTPNNNAFLIDRTNLIPDIVSNETYRAELTKRSDLDTRGNLEATEHAAVNRPTPKENEKRLSNLPITSETNALATDERTTINEEMIAVQTPASEEDLLRTNTVDTPMSCTTDNFTLSASSPVVQSRPFYEDGSSPNEMLCSFETDVTKSQNEDLIKSSMTNLSELSASTNQTSVYNSLSIDEVDMIDNTSLQVHLEKSVIIPLRVQSRLVNNAIIKHFLNEHHMLQHLHSLRSYYFLLNGEFAKSLTDSLYTHLYSTTSPVELFNSATLTNLLKRALINGALSGSYANSELLTLSAIDIPSQLHVSDPGALDCLCLRYKISWPLNIILDDTVMLQYSKVFKFLLMIGRVSWVLQEDFNIMKLERKSAPSEQYHKLQLYRHSMTQFINAFHNYLTCSVLHASWTEFEKDLQHSSTLDELYLAHITYIKKILSRCMLVNSGEKIRSCLNNIFTIILKFHNRLRSRTWINGSRGKTHPNFKSLEQMYEAFCELRTYMVHVALKLTTSGYQPHLAHFLDALNINNLYDLTEKKQKSHSR